MKHLIIYAHPNQESLNAQFKQAIENVIKQQKHKVITRDLYHLGFDPVLSLEDINGQRKGYVNELIRREQEYISWADTVTFIYPIWWTGMPAIMKGYIDRVFSYGFAYRYDQGIQKGLLAGKEAIILNTHGKSNEEYASVGMDKALILTSDKGIYTYCGFQVKEHFFFDKADRASPEVVKMWLAAIRDVYMGMNSQLSNH
ncbi:MULTISPECIES: NAD(P)H-dependent oxidoreductase [unclassified Sphingobacterium]|jgi:NAD(P)H dehydrogenase (quinone)|uniref:NAD(P)H-dependent oxidoreductase n=1 Tax=unclassified Sphingobacterium TaxID=2609468 RepID=UPI002954436F|nr:NAD(P)H-dependent oxidoreductase [Sphingobacterium sp. UGAL515B_05]WON93586.1 NAD(P)H-dependent oxidoreductase [Sphingobacterium sp. UGAL515B_05]